MAFEDQNEYPVGSSNRKHSKFLPRFFRTSTNEKFVNSTIDQLFSPGAVEKLSSFVGRRNAKANINNSTYLSDVSYIRETYQLEPALVVKDELDNVVLHKDYIDYLGQLDTFNSNTTNQSILNEQEMYSWNAHINFDMFSNFREYYWMPSGPQGVAVYGQTTDVVSTYKVSIQSNDDNETFVFSPDGVTQNPTIELYKGQTYKFEIDTPGHPFAFVLSRDFEPGQTFEDSVSNNSTLIEQGITIDNQGDDFGGYIEKGTVTFRVPENLQDSIYYISSNNINTSGLVNVFTIEDSTSINVTKEIIGKKTYTTSKGFDLSNGMKVYFTGNVTPSKYATGEYYIEGVGEAITLVPAQDLDTAGVVTDDVQLPFDNYGFDEQPYSLAIGYPSQKDYITINRASPDLNAWSRYNRWFHVDVITKSANINNSDVTLNADSRAKRPIIEFNAGIQLYKNGLKAKTPIDLIDTVTTDVFSTIEGTTGYNIDQVTLVDGMRILFTADNDPLVQDKIFVVNFIDHKNSNQIALTEADDATPTTNDIVFIKDGVANKGKQYYYTGSAWKMSQEKTSVNQLPLFDLFDENDTSYADYNDSTFVGNKIFSYKVGTGSNDNELGFPLTYKNINNVGDIVFCFNLLKDECTYINDLNLETLFSKKAFVKKIDYNTNSVTFENAWKKHYTKSRQAVVLDYFGVNQTNNFVVNCFTNSASIADLKIKVYKNKIYQDINIDYTIDTFKENKRIVFTNAIDVNDFVTIKCYSKETKNSNGYYEVPYNLERNPDNNEPLEFTIAEVSEHVDTITQNIDEFVGMYPGVSNLRDLGNICIYGDRFVQHTGPINLPLFNLTSKDFNIVNAIKTSLAEYSRFKREFIRIATDDGYNNTPAKHVDYIVTNINLDKRRENAFYNTDMLPIGGKTILEYTVLDEGNPYYPLSSPFSLNELSNKAVIVYVNGNQVLHNIDYTFTDEGFVFFSNIAQNDTIEIHEYENTEGSYVPATPTKLGLYPLFKPELIADTTYNTTQNFVRGHDGSLTLAYNDYRDDLLLELEKRIYNNVKKSYDSAIFDISNYVPGLYRNTGISKQDFDNIMIADFVNWTNVAQVYNYYTNNSDRDDSFSWNYRVSSDATGSALPGFWRGIYKFAFDTDTPNLTPWEMLGYSIKPTWWEGVYGPAPYTSDNKPLWQDLQEGKVKEPGKSVVIKKQYKRPGLLNNIPVDENGQVVSPYIANFVKDFTFNTQIETTFRFGDHNVTETAWRRSSEYAFSLLIALCILKPAEVFGLGYDRSNISTNVAGNKVYNNFKSISTDEILFPDTNYTSGLVNYIYDYSKYKNIDFSLYKSNIQGITNNLSFRLAGFSDKSKLNLLLDSKTPNSSGTIFAPQENYNISLKTSSSFGVASYSGVIIEKVAGGYKIDGYDRYDPNFEYVKPKINASDPNINVGGVSEEFAIWNENKLYVSGIVVEYNSSYYRVTKSHTSTGEFEAKNFTPLKSLPIQGGKAARFSKNFETKVSKLQYGSVIKEYQDVVDFLLGYSKYLESQGFVFDNVNSGYEIVENWSTAAQEFLFWTTQNWGENSLITLSPGANKILFNKDYATPDNIYDSIFDYEILDQDGKLVTIDFSNIVRTDENSFSLTTTDSARGIFFVRLFLVQKEHVVVIDNETIFADTIYNPISGYRQERIKTSGYRTADWNGTLAIPGFVYDQPNVKTWTSYTDYQIGDVVKYKDFYYASNAKFSSGQSFDSNNWTKLSEKPENTLIPNFEYKADQFADFYDLDTDNFDAEQQKFAQHTIAYQKRTYLQNIINDDTSQYKFYQGMLQDKGTTNVLTKLFDKLSSANQESIETYEEWALRLGQYGATDGFKEFEIPLDETKFQLSPQPIEFVNSVDPTRTDLIYEIPGAGLSIKPLDYNNTIFATHELEQYTKTGGYVAPKQIDYITTNIDQILGADANTFEVGDKLWVTSEKQSWNVYQIHQIDNSVMNVTATQGGFVAEFEKLPTDISVGDIIGILNVNNDVDGYRIVRQMSGKLVEFWSANTIESQDLSDSTLGSIVVLKSLRYNNPTELNDESLANGIEPDTYAWIDDVNGNWKTLKNNPVYTNKDVRKNPREGILTEFAKTFDVNTANTTMVVGDSEGDGRFFVFDRISDKDPYLVKHNIQADTDIIGSSSSFGAAVALTSDTQYVFVGAPNASNIPNRYRGVFDISGTYSIGDIVSDRGILWRAVNPVVGDGSTITSFTQDWESVDAVNIDTDSPYSNPIIEHGAVLVYKKTLEGYELFDSILPPSAANNEHFGKTIKLRKNTDGKYVLFVGSDGGNGRIYFLDNNTLTGKYRYAVNRNFKGEFSLLSPYNLGEIVYYEMPGLNGGSLYSANSNLAAGVAFNFTNWTLLDNYIEHVGYLPNTSLILQDESDSLGVERGENIGDQYDVSKNGDVLIVNAQVGTREYIVSVYRKENGRYGYYQTLTSEISGEDYGKYCAISDDGTQIAISSTRNDATGQNNGKVYIYTQNNQGEFEKSQELTSVAGNENEKFGISLNFSGDILAIASEKGDRIIPEIYDSSDITFDAGTTTFVRKYEDESQVFIFQKIFDTWIYAEEMVLNIPTKPSLEPIVLAKENHVYISYPELEVEADYGAIVDLRRDRDVYSWAVDSEQIPSVDLSKVKRTFVYDKNTSDIIQYLDLIDPIQGKVAGIAEQNLDYKTGYDPAEYSISDQDIEYNQVWNSNYAGKYWWEVSSSKWYNPYQDSIEYQTSYWNKLLPGYSINVYEWIESDYLPDEYDNISQSDQAGELNITGLSKYGNYRYSIGRKYDPVAEKFTTKYYYWVSNKQTVTNNDKDLSVFEIANIIADPRAAGIRYAMPLSENRLSLVNCESIINDKDTILHIDLYKGQTNNDRNIHTEYKLISEGLDYSNIPSTLITKWIDSLVGYDIKSRPVPDKTLAHAQRYGIENKPRQGMFVNNQEALKQVIERANKVLSQNIITDFKNIQSLFEFDKAPSKFSGEWDTTVNSQNDLDTVGVAKFKQAKLTPIVQNGKIVDVQVNDVGYGYKIAPTVTITGNGTGAEITTSIDAFGKINGTVIKESGKNYTSASCVVRKFAVLVQIDSTIEDRWAVYQYNETERNWFRAYYQEWNVTNYWSYVDYYASGYDANTAIDFVAEGSYALESLNDQIGDVVKIKNIGTGGWLLLRKVDAQTEVDYTVNYETIGRENGTIEISNKLYVKPTTGFDNIGFDTIIYDREPYIETRKILQALKDNIFIDDLSLDFHNLFFISLRYALTEQQSLDWAFKTSFIKAKHNVGALEQKVTFKNDNLSSFEDFINEVKPYKVNIREFISSYENIENSQSNITDFDLPPRYDIELGKITTENLSVNNGLIVGDTTYVDTNPQKNWKDNYKYKIKELVIYDAGYGLNSQPVITISGANGPTIVGKGYRTNNTLGSIEIDTTGAFYTTVPTITIDASYDEDYREPRIIAILGDGVVRATHMTMKFDRTTGKYSYSTLNETETFTGTGSQDEFTLIYPLDTRTTKISITKDGYDVLSEDYVVENVVDTTKGYTRYKGKVTFETAPELNSNVVIKYYKSPILLSAEDRVQFFYQPTSGMPGKDLSQLMDGVDYDGVLVDSIDFSTSQGWDTGGFGDVAWDVFTEIEDEIFILDGSTNTFELAAPLEDGAAYNVYKGRASETNLTRIDDPNYDVGSGIQNKNALMNTIYGDGIQTTVVLNEELIQTNEGDKIIFRKSTSDGSFIPVEGVLDTELSGGAYSNGAYSNAAGTDSGEIIVDGDGFVTATTSKGPEELVPGQIVDALDIRVLHKPDDGQAIKQSYFYEGDNTTGRYAVDFAPQTQNSLIVILDGEKLPSEDYSFDYETNEVVIETGSSLPEKYTLSIVVIGNNGEKILDSDTFAGDGTTREFITGIKFKEDVTSFVTINGNVQLRGGDYILFETDDTYKETKCLAIRFGEAPSSGDIITYNFYDSETKTYSEMVVTKTVVPERNVPFFKFTDDNKPGTSTPLGHQVLIRVNNNYKNAGYNIRHTITDETRAYSIQTWQFDKPTQIASEEVFVYVNNKLIRDIFDYVWDPINGRIQLVNDSVGLSGEILEIYVLGKGEYFFIDTKFDLLSTSGTLDIDLVEDQFIELTLNDSTTIGVFLKSYEEITGGYRLTVYGWQEELSKTTDSNRELLEMTGLTSDQSALINNIEFVESDTLTLLEKPQTGDVVEIITFNEHDINNFDRISSEVLFYEFVPNNTNEYIKRNLLSKGYITLNSTATNANYVWVIKNGKLLRPFVDYKLSDDKNIVELAVKPNENDYIEVLHFASKPTSNKFGFRIFKDILNRVHYKRLNVETEFKLSQPLNWYDQSVQLVDASDVPVPNRGSGKPGVMFIEGERLEYYGVDGNTLTFLRRGTLGTSIADQYEAETTLQYQGKEETIPYQDKKLTTLFVGDGTSSVFDLDFDLSAEASQHSTNTSSTSTLQEIAENIIDVYKGGKKLRNIDIDKFDLTIDQDSLEADVTLPKEFSVDLETNTITLVDLPLDGERVVVARRQGQIWTNNSESMVESETKIARFIRGATIKLTK